MVDPSGVRVKGLGKDGRPREVHLYHLADNAWTMAEFLDLWSTATVSRSVCRSGCRDRRPGDRAAR